MLIRTLSISLLLLALSACEGLFDVAGPPGMSSLRFQHSGFAGGAAGLYSAMGEVPLLSTGQMPYGDWAYALRDGAVPPGVFVVASHPAADGRFDVARISLPSGVGPGDRITFLEMCETAPACGSMSFDIGLHPGTFVALRQCWVRNGELRVLRLTGRRVAGTFSGTAVCAGVPGETQITGGEFDVAMLDADG
ncbi:MAG TPA: hypothetical protein VGX50_05485 [Longimicrobium sp.]|jgi:hypothetical protein|nr:hypothetical protein [Longimicrobium sp.]